MAGAKGTSHFTLEELAPGVHAAQAVDGGLALCNAGIVDLGDRTVVFDSMLTPQAGADLRKVAERLTGRPVDYLVNSHYHGDHVRGNASFLPVRVVSSRRTRELLAERGRAHLVGDLDEAEGELRELRAGRKARIPADGAVYEGWLAGLRATPRDLPIVLPDVTFDSELMLHGTRRSLRVATYGGGHSPSDVFAFLPDERVLFAGDLVTVGFHPWLTDGDPARLTEILGRLRELHADRVVPGHGPAGADGDIGAMQEYLVELGRLVGGLGGGRPSASQVPMPSQYSRWKFADQFERNLAFLAERAAP